ncbi:MAG: hypothetical protein KGO49_06275 [Gammaproteobacteria bacterium]|nr:hypothetical protein [Gammaproteobacteria bacterium]
MWHLTFIDVTNRWRQRSFIRQQYILSGSIVAKVNDSAGGKFELKGTNSFRVLQARVFA